RTWFDILKFKRKCISVHWEFMCTRSLFTITDITAQHPLLNEISELIDAGTLKTTPGQHLGPINAAT
ncbi:zinc-binding alcohol dehydrogenase family protein, partial [Pseudoalteromonas sp. SIMBA_162]